MSEGAPGDSGLAMIAVIARFHGIAAEPAQLAHQLGLGSQRATETELAQCARSLGLKQRTVTLSPERLGTTPLPALMLDRSGRHFVLAAAKEGGALILEADSPQPRTATHDEWMSRGDGRAMLFTSRASLAGAMARFDFTWFIPAAVKYRSILLEVTSISMLLQVFGLITPLMFQVVMDKVLVNRAFSTLAIVCVALLVASLFEILLTGLRNYVFSHTTNRIDVELGAKLFRHLIALPLGYFGARRVGDTVARVRELEGIRNFLTGQALTALIDMLFSVIFIAVMCVYSVKLTLIVVASLPLYAAVSFVINPILRQRLDEKFAAGANNQSFLVETVSGIETVKALAVDSHFTRRWDQQLASYVSASFRVGVLGNVGQQLIQLVGKLVTVATLFFGAKLVIDGRMTVGQLVAFNMLAQRVSAPILRLAQLWQDFQQVGISMQRLGDILNTRTEIPQSRQVLPPIRGAVQFDAVRFRYRADGPLVLKNISFELPAGQIIGIVGRSGSGKSTITKLLQRLYVPEHGQVRIDGIDIALADPPWLRRQIGVVLQENFLFNRSVRENIALTDPGMPLESVIQAAKLAGAHDFITAMPEGYDTPVGEHGAGLSGGQKQRIAIARALATNPRILVFDEATSALDLETEQALQTNMAAICRGRTVVIIAHRLSAVRHANKIIAMDAGEIVEHGHHDDLVAANGYYAHLVSLQAA